MNNRQIKPITFFEFTDMLSEIVLAEQENLTPTTDFVEDLSVDSLKFAEMAFRIDQLGVTIPTKVYWDIQTVGDAYQAYLYHFNLNQNQNKP